jgi:hypothetical protein
MAIVSALLSLLIRKMSDILTAIFGWSITALFGKLPGAKQTALTVALVMSLAWPLLVLGCFLPAVGAWAVAFVPLQRWLSEGALRTLWIVLAVLVPVGVGGITRWITPNEKLHGGVLKTLLGGYSLTIGYFVAFVLTLVTVPVVKVLSTIKGWTDTHVFVQPREGKYLATLEELAAACAAVKEEVQIEPVPTPMALATRAIKWFARGIVDPITPTDPRRLRGKAIELYLYPADLLFRGDAKKVAHVRAAMVRTMIERHAYLVEEPEAQGVENELEDMWDLIARHKGSGEIGAAASSRLREIAKELDGLDISFEAWSTLETSLRRLERAVAGGPTLIDAHAGPDAGVQLEVHEQRAHGAPVPTVDLIKQAVAEARELSTLEVALAKEEVKREVKDATRGAIFLGVGAALEILALVALAVVATVALAKVMVIPIVIAALLVGVTVGAAVFAIKKLPRRPRRDTERRVKEDVKELKQQIAP